jgi:uncharacterized protein (TIGR00369 family)
MSEDPAGRADEIDIDAVTLGQLLGTLEDEAADGRSRLVYPFRRALATPRNVLQGGMQAALIDRAMIRAVRSLLGEDAPVSTSELTVHYLRPAVGEYFVCEAEVLRAGKTVVFVEATLKDDHGRLVARGASSLVRSGGSA